MPPAQKVPKPKGKKKLIKKPAALIAAKAKKPLVQACPYFEKRPKNFGIGQAVQHKRDLTRFVKWPKYIRLQRQKAVLFKRLKIPPSLNQFRGKNCLDKQGSNQVFRLLEKYKPEDKHQRKQRRLKEAEARAAGKEPKPTRKPSLLQHGVRRVTSLVEQKKANLVVIAHDVDPIELVLHLPHLCRKMGVAYCVIKGRSRLGQLIHRKTCSCVCLADVRREDQSSLATVADHVKGLFNNRADDLKKNWGGQEMSAKTRAKVVKIEKIKAMEGRIYGD